MSDQVLKFVGGPRDGEEYRVPQGMTVRTLTHTGWTGKYVFVAPNPKSLTQFAPHLAWRGR